MGSEYFPAPSAATRLLGPDGVPLSGDVTLAPGNNQAITRTTAPPGFLLSGTPAAPVRIVQAFSPGILVARSLISAQVFAPVVQAVDVFCLTAPSGVTGVSCGNVQVAGSISGALVLPLSAAGVAEYHLGRQNTSAVLAGETFSGNQAAETVGGSAYHFRVSATLNILNADILWSTTGNQSFSCRFGLATGVGLGTQLKNANWLTDADGNKAFVDMDTTNLNLGTYIPVTFPGTKGYQLVAGTDYYFVVASTSHNGSGQNVVRTAVNQNTSSVSSPVGSEIVQADEFLCNSLVDDTITVNQHLSGANNSALHSFNLYGSILGAILTGNVIISTTLTATPATPGSDINVRVAC